MRYILCCAVQATGVSLIIGFPLMLVFRPSRRIPPLAFYKFEGLCYPTLLMRRLCTQHHPITVKSGLAAKVGNLHGKVNIAHVQLVTNS